MNNIEKVITRTINKYFVDNNIKFTKGNDFTGTLSEYFHSVTKGVKVKKRKVLVSRELNSKIKNKEITDEYIEIINKFKNNFNSGIDMTGHLSKQIYNGYYYDKLLISWGIYHYHLNEQAAHSKSEMTHNRSDMLLFCIVDDNIVYFLDAESHSRNSVFSMFNLLTVIYNNWEFLISKYEIKNAIPGTLQPTIIDDKTLNDFRKSNINIAYEINNKYYMFPDGLTSAGTSVSDIRYIFKIKRKIIKELPKPPIYMKNVEFKLDKNNNSFGWLSWNEGEEKKLIEL